MTYIHTSIEKGERKENSVVTLVVGFLKRMLIPVFMKGIVKSTASSRDDVMVRSTMAMSATCQLKEKQ